MTIRLANFNIQPPVVLAPMAGVTDRPFRLLCRQLGAGMAVSEMVSANSLLWGSAKTQRRADHEGEPAPRVVQILGADPTMMAQAARHNVAHGAQIIDINMGCPAKKVCNAQAGSALLKDEALVAEILRAVVAAVAVPVTLKIRTGWDKANRNGVRIAHIAEECGIRALAVHGRTRACKYEGAAEYDTIAAIKQAVRIPVLANGDITNPDKAQQVLAYTGADGVMIGRAAQGNPWIFREIAHFLHTGQRLPPPLPAEIRDTLLAHLRALYAFYGEYAGVRVARKHLGWFSKGQPNGAAFRRFATTLTGMQQQLQAVEDFFAQLLTQA